VIDALGTPTDHADAVSVEVERVRGMEDEVALLIL